MVRPQLRERSVRGSKPDFTVYVDLKHVKSDIEKQTPFRWSAWKLGEGLPPYMLSSSSGNGSQLRGPSKNNSRVASTSKQDVNTTNLST
ncbi:hypothetical protein AVEN_42476-1 [Araneus ventricosus]|uniref:Uncharacterized protein n=1 Tax=Araneus ventricosus TaxID=182803 RepID=A0A4Y2MZX5_ARAVE|nr:hypothetical protein AVEN_42476-1 [Araneus ventricosus]